MNDRRFLSKEELVGGFRAAGLNAGDVLFLHADTMVIAQFKPAPQEERLQTLFEAFMEVLGPGGTLIVPTFTYSFCRDEIYEVNHSPSQGMGLFSEFVRTLKQARRSLDPIFSVAVIGRLAPILCDLEIGDSFGPQSIFAALRQHGAKIVCLGCALDRVTFVHYVEQCHGIPYRYPKSFSGKIITETGKTMECSVSYYVNDYSKNYSLDLTPLKKQLLQKGKMKTGSLGRVGIYAIAANDFFEEAKLMLSHNPYGLVKANE